MSPLPQEPPSFGPAVDLRDDDIVVTGISGMFPGCHNVKEFSEKLYNGDNMIRKSTRWDFEHPEVSQYSGSVPGLENFDAQFFMVHYRLGNSMDGMSRKLMEHAYQAIYDAGVNPSELSGGKNSVLVGCGFSETEKVCSFTHVGLGIVGCNHSMFSNRVSYCLNFKGPSITVDSGCSSTLTALKLAYDFLKTGQCDAALVGGSTIHLHPQFYIHSQRMFLVNPDGKTKSFSKDADGLSQSEAIGMIFLQKYKNAKRVYAKLCHAKSETIATTKFKYSPQRPLSISTAFLSDFYKEAKISPSEVEFVEAFGIGIPEADKAELESFEKIFCENRTKELLVGSVMSNVGYSDAASGFQALAKVCLSYHRGELPANLHCEAPRDDVKALRDGQIQIVTKNRPFNRSYVAVNSTSFCGNNCHALLQGYYKPKNLERYKSAIPYLVTISSRQEDGVRKILDYLKSHPVDPEELALFHNIHRLRISKHMARGFTILSTNKANETEAISEKAEYYDETRRPLWFVYSGMGSQWAGMGRPLLRIPVFAEAIERCHKVLEPKGVDLMHILTADDSKIYDNILNSFVGIAAVQIGLTDVLKSIGVVPDKIIGHSVGELGCAYADGCLTADEMILSAYSRGLVSVQTPFIKGSMAAVGLGYQQVKSMCPPEIEVACHNSGESSTISGPAEAMAKFVASLTSRGVFAKEVPCSNIAYHSRYIKEAGPGLLKYLSEVIKTPKLRSNKWVSTSVPVDKWELPIAKFSSAEYHTNNLLSPVLFEEAARMIPPNAILVEVAPHGLLQAILKRSLPSCTNVPLARRGHKDNVLVFLEAIGSMYMVGVDLDVSVLYPKVQFPVSTETRSISHLVSWIHSEKWQIPKYLKAERTHASASEFSISIHDNEHQYLRGYSVDGTMTYPLAGILMCAWDTLAMSVDVAPKSISVVFRDVHVYTLPKMDEDHPLQLSVEIQRGTGKFEVSNNKVLLVIGCILAATPDGEAIEPVEEKTENNITENDVYRILYEKGYQHSGEFRVIQSMNGSVTKAKIAKRDNWITFMDALIQMSVLRQNSMKHPHPNYIMQMAINTKAHQEELTDNQRLDKSYFDAVFEKGKTLKCGGVTIKNFTFIDKPLTQKQSVVLNALTFKPFFQKDVVDMQTALSIYVQTISDNINTNQVKVTEIIEHKEDNTIIGSIEDLVSGLPDIKMDYTVIDKNNFLVNKVQKPDVVIFNCTMMDKHINEALNHLISNESFVIVLEEIPRSTTLYKAVSSVLTPKGRLVLAKWKPAPQTHSAIVAKVATSKDLVQLLITRQKMKTSDRLVILTPYPPFHGLTDLVQKYRKEPQRNNVVLAMLDQKSFDKIQGNQLPEFDLVFNRLHQGIWGSDLYAPILENTSKDREVMLRSSRDGDIESLRWVEVPEPPQRSGIRVKVHYAGLNYLDAKKANGEYFPCSDALDEFTYGMDYSGTTKNGERVMGIVGSGSACTHVQAEPSLLWPVPTSWSLEDAATVPLAFAQAFYILAIKCELLPGMSILVHGATGGLGQALLTIALAHNCRVFATVSDLKKKKFLRKIFPEIPEDHIGNSRDGSFVDMIHTMTKGAGCNFVVSCLKGNLTNDALKCAGDFGITIDTHNLQTKENLQLGMYCLSQERAYVPIDFSTIFTHHNKEEMKKIQVMLSEGITRGYVRPLTRVTYGWSDAQRAFRLLAASRHRGRVLLNLQGPLPPAVPRLQLSQSGSHLVISTNEDNMLTLRLMDLLVDRGARAIVLQNRCQPSHGDGHLQMKIRYWQKQGVRIKIIGEDSDAEQLISEAKKLGPLEGALVVSTEDLDDRLETELADVLNDLDAKTRKVYPNILYFAILTGTSKVAQGVCYKRQSENHPATMLKLSNLEKFENSKNIPNEVVTETGMDWLCVSEAIERVLKCNETIASAHGVPHSRLNIAEEVFKIPGMKMNGQINFAASLDQLGLNADGCRKLSEILEKKFDIVISKFDLPHMTLNDLRMAQESRTSTAEDTISGLDAFWPSIDTEQMQAVNSVILMPTLVRGNDVREDEFEYTQPHLVMIPGFDGHHDKFADLAKRLKIMALVIQPDLNYPNESIPEIAKRLAKIMNQSLKLGDKFYLLGYSFGALVALEMASILERQGKKGVVFCVDAEPDTFPSALETWLDLNGTDTQEKFQDTIVLHAYRIITGEDSDELRLKLKVTHDWDSKVTEYTRILHKKVNLTVEYAKELLESVYGRIQQARRYVTTLKEGSLNSQIVLIRSRCQFASGADLARYSTTPLKIFDVKTDHARSLQDLTLTNIVNSHLGKDILDAYDALNHCTPYLLNKKEYCEFSTDVPI